MPSSCGWKVRGTSVPGMGVMCLPLSILCQLEDGRQPQSQQVDKEGNRIPKEPCGTEHSADPYTNLSISKKNSYPVLSC
jgi:hypothetical protein